MAKTQYLAFEVHLTDSALVTQLNAQYGLQTGTQAVSRGVFMAPDDAAATWGAPLKLSWAADLIPPMTTSPWFWFNEGSPGRYPTNVAEFTRKSGGWFGISWLFGTTTVYKWVGRFVAAMGEPGETLDDDGLPQPRKGLTRRRWIIGFESPSRGDNGGIQSGSGVAITRGASRHLGGFGLAHRSYNSSYTAFVNDQNPGLNPPGSWERFYMRVHRYPSQQVQFWWTTNGSGVSADGVALGMLPTGVVAVMNKTAASSYSVQGTTQKLDLGKWYRIDILFSYATGAGGAGSFAKLYINGRQVFSQTGFTSPGLGRNGGWHRESDLGQTGVSAGSEFDADFDDWICCDVPESLNAWDWQSGSSVRAVSAIGFTEDTTPAAWTGGWQHLLHRIVSNIVGGVVTSTPEAELHVHTDFVETVAGVPHSRGIAAFSAAAFLAHAGTVNHGVGFVIGGVEAWDPGMVYWPGDFVSSGGESYVAIKGHVNQPPPDPDFWLLSSRLQVFSAPQNRHLTTLWSATGALEPVRVRAAEKLELRYVKEDSSVATTVRVLHGVAEHLGRFGPEDFPDDLDEEDLALAPLGHSGVHNAPYPHSPWAQLGPPPQSPVIIKSGTYAGNGDVTELTFLAPVHYLFIHNKTTANNARGNHWFSTMIAGHMTNRAGVLSNVATQVRINALFMGGDVDEQQTETVVRITGDSQQFNQAGQEYWYIAISDPGMRFLLCDGVKQYDQLNRFLDEKFFPEAAFVQPEIADSVTTTAAQYIKNLSHATTFGSRVDQAAAANVLEFELGGYTPGSVVTPSGPNPSVAIAFWRRSDGSGDPGVVVQLGSYVGDGSGARVIPLTPASGRRPVYVIVTPHNAASVLRTPGYTGNTSGSLSSGNSVTTGITAGGIDEITVGALLNANEQTYDVFAIPGDVDGDADGWSVDGEFIPVEPDTPTGSQWDDVVEPSDVPPPGPPDPGDVDPGPDLGGDLELSPLCVAVTTRVVNLALTRIGVSQVIVDLSTDPTREAHVARIVYEEEARTVLRAFPWPFATKYAALALVGGSAANPVNGDWTFAYQRPADCIFERRLVVARGAAMDPTPPPFMLGHNAVGDGLIFTNEPNARLEYTARPECVAFSGDALFRDALAWKLAAALAPALSRMADRATQCEQLYQQAIQHAQEVIKPGVPGHRTVAAGVDDACQAGVVAVVNRALIRIGARTVANLTTEQSREAIEAALVFEAELRAVLRDFPWPFATRYAQNLVLVGGSIAERYNADWHFAHRLPADVVLVRRLVTHSGREFDPEPPRFRVGSDAQGPLLFSHLAAPVIEYTARFPCLVDASDALFQEALSWKLASTLAPSLAHVDPELAEQHGRGPEDREARTMRLRSKPSATALRRQIAREAWMMYTGILMQARASAAKEQQQPPDGDAEWIRGR